MKGQTPRVYRNALFFLYPSEDERAGFNDTIRHIMAYEMLTEDKTQNLSDDQKGTVRKELQKRQRRFPEAIQRLYRRLAVPTKDGINELDFGIPTPGDKTGFAQRAYEKLRLEGEVLEKIAPLVLETKYLKDKDYVLTEQIYESSLRTPGEPRPISREVFERSIAEGVTTGLFGLGILLENRPVCYYFEQTPSVALSENEVMMSKNLCIIQQQQVVIDTSLDTLIPSDDESATGVTLVTGIKAPQATDDDAITRLRLIFRLPRGKVSDVLQVIRYLQTKFEAIGMELALDNGGISERDYEDKIEEAFRQMGIDLDRQ